MQKKEFFLLLSSFGFFIRVRMLPRRASPRPSENTFPLKSLCIGYMFVGTPCQAFLILPTLFFSVEPLPPPSSPAIFFCARERFHPEIGRAKPQPPGFWNWFHLVLPFGPYPASKCRTCPFFPHFSPLFPTREPSWGYNIPILSPRCLPTCDSPPAPGVSNFFEHDPTPIPSIFFSVLDLVFPQPVFFF